jgi:hypothetical protein
MANGFWEAGRPKGMGDPPRIRMYIFRGIERDAGIAMIPTKSQK